MTNTGRQALEGPDFELVEWVDSFGLAAGWQHLQDVDPRPVTVLSAGVVLAEHEDVIVLAAHLGYVGEDINQVGGALAIPKAAIVRRQRATWASCPAPGSGPTQQPTSPPSSTSDREGSSTPSTQRTATSARSEGAFS